MTAGPQAARLALRRRPSWGSVTAAWARRRLWRTAFAVAARGVKVAGPRPREGCVVVANHSSHADIAALIAALPARTAPVVAAAADHWFASRLRAAVCRALTGGRPVRRDGGGWEDLRGLAVHLAQGRVVVVFPEGTRTRDGSLGRFRSGAFRLAAEAGVPVVPAAILGSAEVLPPQEHGRVHRARCEVRFGAPLRESAEAPERARAEVQRMLEAAPRRPRIRR